MASVDDYILEAEWIDGVIGVGGEGGNGGAYGASGVAGTTEYQAGGVGGAAGYGIRKNGHAVTVTNNGTITGTVG